jgi:isoamylase
MHEEPEAAASEERDERGRPVEGDSLLLLLNGGTEPCTFVLPSLGGRGAWRVEVDTADPASHRRPAGACDVAPHALVLLRHA